VTTPSLVPTLAAFGRPDEGDLYATTSCLDCDDRLTGHSPGQSAHSDREQRVSRYRRSFPNRLAPGGVVQRYGAAPPDAGCFRVGRGRAPAVGLGIVRASKADWSRFMSGVRRRSDAGLPSSPDLVRGRPG
jgi:hypothetical protein